jgi:hypothetical protein
MTKSIGILPYYCNGPRSVAALLNDDGIAEQYRYDAFGNTKVYDGSGAPKSDFSQMIGNPYMFTIPAAGSGDSARQSMDDLCDAKYGNQKVGLVVRKPRGAKVLPTYIIML